MKKVVNENQCQMLEWLFLWFHDTINLHCFIDPDFDLDLLRDGWSPEANSTDLQDSPFEAIVFRDAFPVLFENDTPDSFKRGQ
jgi:hypothetical protein